MWLYLGQLLTKFLKIVWYENFLYKGCLDKKGGVKIKMVCFKPHCIQCQFQLCNLYHWDLLGTCNLLPHWYIGPLGLNPDRVASIHTWLDSPCVLEICELLVTKYDQIWSKDRSVFEARPNFLIEHKTC